MLSFDQNISHFRDLHQILGRRDGFKMKSMSWPKIRISLNYSTSIFVNFWIFKRKRELYALFHKDSENRVLFDVRSVVTELQSILRSKKQKIADFFLKCWVLIKIFHIFVISIKFWVGEMDLKWNPCPGQKSEFLWTIVRRFLSIFEFSNGNVSCMHYFMGIPKIGFFLTLGQ